MSVVSIDKDLESRTLTVVAEWAAPLDQVWELWADPRKLERWWGPPGFPATVAEFDLQPGGKVAYYMTSPEGDQYHGWWRVIAVDPPRRLELQDGFADGDGNEIADMPTSTMVVTLTEHAGGVTRMETVSTWPTVEAMQKTIEMGVEEGLRAALGQVDAVLGIEVVPG